jgi:hypothetical protein
MSDDPICECGHPRSEHDEEQPYECFGVCGYADEPEGCDCQGFEFHVEAR